MSRGLVLAACFLAVSFAVPFAAIFRGDTSPSRAGDIPGPSPDQKEQHGRATPVRTTPGTATVPAEIVGPDRKAYVPASLFVSRIRKDVYQLTGTGRHYYVRALFSGDTCKRFAAGLENSARRLGMAPVTDFSEQVASITHTTPAAQPKSGLWAHMYVNRRGGHRHLIIRIVDIGDSGRSEDFYLTPARTRKLGQALDRACHQETAAAVAPSDQPRQRR